MSGGAWLLSWSKHNLDKKAPRARPAGGNAASGPDKAVRPERAGRREGAGAPLSGNRMPPPSRFASAPTMIAASPVPDILRKGECSFSRFDRFAILRNCSDFGYGNFSI